MSIRKLLTKINDAIRPPHVGPLPPTDVTALGETLNSDLGGDVAGKQANLASQWSIGPK